MAVALLLTMLSFIGNITSLVQDPLPTLLWFTAPVLVAGVTWIVSRYQARQRERMLASCWHVRKMLAYFITSLVLWP